MSSPQRGGSLLREVPTTVRPRWEWRVFEPAPATFIAGVAPSQNAESSLEIYILSSRSPHNTKIRAGVLDVKRLEGLGRDGIELWRPVLKEPFPIAADRLAPIWNAWGIRALTTKRAVFTRDDFLSEIVARRHDVLRVVTVTKARSKLSGFSCGAAERAWLTVVGEQWETFALEDEDPAQVVAAQELLGADRPHASNYPAWLKGVVGMSEPVNLLHRASI